MVSRPHLSIVPANGLPERVRSSMLRVLAVAGIAVALAGFGYAAARFTPLFALRELEVTGGSAAVHESVREAAAPFLGESLVALDQEAVRRQLAALPTVRAVSIDRAFPHTLRIDIVPERALAVVRNGQEAWLVSERGRVIRSAEPEAVDRRPVVWTAAEPDLEPGATVQGENVRLALQGLRQLPAGFPERVRSARAEAGAVTLVLADGTQIRLGKAEAVALKLAVAGRVLGTMSGAERAELAYLDVSIPERAVGGTSLDSQVEGET